MENSLLFQIQDRARRHEGSHIPTFGQKFQKFHAQPQTGAYIFLIVDVSQIRTRYCNKQNNKRPFSAKNELNISEPNFTKSEGKARFGHFF